MSLSSLKTVSLQRFSLNFAANIIAAIWMLIGSTRAFSWVKPTFVQFACFALIALGSNVLFSWLAAESGSVFNEQGLVSYLIWPVIILLAGIILARRSGNQSLLFVPAVLWLVADSISALLQSLVQFLALKLAARLELLVFTGIIFSTVFMANSRTVMDLLAALANALVGAHYRADRSCGPADYLAKKRRRSAYFQTHTLRANTRRSGYL